jgi:hypothetical protein
MFANTTMAGTTRIATRGRTEVSGLPRPSPTLVVNSASVDFWRDTRETWYTQLRNSNTGK